MKYVLFGAGRLGRKILQMVGEENILGFIDNNITGDVLGKPVLPLKEAMETYLHGKIVVCISKNTPNLLQQVEMQLYAAGIQYLLYTDFFLKYFENCRKHNNDYYQVFKNEIDYMLEHESIEMIPYSFRDYYLSTPLETQFDQLKSLYFFCYQGKRIYFPESFGNHLPSYLRALLIEQDLYSPHRYFTAAHNVNCDDIFVDCGGAEALSSVEVIDRVQKVYIFEGNPLWTEALSETFYPYRDKVVIVPKFLGNQVSENMVTIDSYFENVEGNLFFKVDIEGNESAFLEGARNTLHRPGTRLSLCTYHKPHDAKEFSYLLMKEGYTCSLSKGWLFVSGDFVKGVLYASK